MSMDDGMDLKVFACCVGSLVTSPSVVNFRLGLVDGSESFTSPYQSREESRIQQVLSLMQERLPPSFFHMGRVFCRDQCLLTLPQEKPNSFKGQLGVTAWKL